MSDTSTECPFCAAADIVIRNDLAYARYDKNPVTRGHLLIIPFRHEPNFFAITREEREAIFALSDQARLLLEREFRPDGFNLGVNVGAAAGQTIEHVHLHLIPRCQGDIADPRGGVRGVIPDKQKY